MDSHAASLYPVAPGSDDDLDGLPAGRQAVIGIA
jgi:hypothetical protein